MSISDKEIIAHLGNYVERSPRTGRLRVRAASNDVLGAIEKLGGVPAAAVQLDVSEEEVDRWIDEHFVPFPKDTELAEHTGYSSWSLQTPSQYLEIDGRYWPPTGYMTQRGRELRQQPRPPRPRRKRRVRVSKNPDHLTNEEFRTHVLELLAAHYGSSFLPPPESLTYENCYEDLTVEDVLQATQMFIICLDLGGGSGFYEPVLALLLDPEMRANIEALLEGWMPPRSRYRGAEKLIPS